MSTKLNNNQLLAAELLASGMMSKKVAEKLNIRSETLSRWKSNDNFILAIEKFNSKILEEIINEQVYLVKISQNTIRNVLENKSVDCCKRANIALAYIKSFNGINTFHEKFKIKFDNLIDNDDSETKFLENMWKILDMARDIKLKGASASDEEINEFADEVGSLEKNQNKSF